jgi:hypothetical protein
METTARYAGWLALVAGALTVAVTVILLVLPDSPAWMGFFAVALLLAFAIVGLERRTSAATGALGRWSAWLTIGALVAVLAVLIWSSLSYGELTGEYDFANDPFLPFWLVTGTAWLLGTVGYAVALVRGGVSPSLGAWLVVIGALASVGALVGVAVGLPIVVATACLGVFGLGWLMIGYSAVAHQPMTARQG